VRNICFTSTSHLILLDILFVLRVKLITFLPSHRCAVWFNLKYIFVWLCKENSQSETFDTVQTAELQVWPGSGLSLSKYFWACIQNAFYNIKSNEFFLSWRRFVVLTAVTSVSEVSDCNFSSSNSVCKQAVFFFSLLGLVSHYFWEGDSGKEISMRWHCVEKINHSRDPWLVLRSQQAGFSYL